MTDQIVKLMKLRENQLKKAIQRAMKDVGGFPEGRLRSSSRKGKDRYYHVPDKGNPDGTYIRRGDRILAQRLAQKEYNEEFIRRAQGEVDALQGIIKKLTEEGVDPFYEHMIPSRKKLIAPYIMDNELYAAEWQAK
ncbi:MAG: hypothetical protein J6Z35_02010, partial [Lachnospiraceae bacterium]|nr:hypothetical protein [Lachnospiraceae bacterium]